MRIFLLPNNSNIRKPFEFDNKMNVNLYRDHFFYFSKNEIPDLNKPYVELDFICKTYNVNCQGLVYDIENKKIKIDKKLIQSLEVFSLSDYIKFSTMSNKLENWNIIVSDLKYQLEFANDLTVFDIFHFKKTVEELEKEKKRIETLQK